MNLRVGVLFPLLLAGPAGAQPVYKCVEDGKITYTDRPCAAGAVASSLPGVIVVAPPGRSERELARQAEARLERERAERDRGDAQWLKQHGERKDREARVRKAIVGHKVIKGMTMNEVRQSLGEPDHVSGGESFGSDKASWTYTDAAGTRTVNFKNGEVTTSRLSRAKRNKGRR